jgi:hypothetical protein
MNAIGPGDWVEAVKTEAAMDGTSIVTGSLYCVEMVGAGGGFCSDCSSQDWLTLHGEPETGFGWCPCGFRPVYRPNADLIEHLKTPAPEIERELHDA